jgi:transcription elongation GreA/GreB family factor
LGLVTFNEKQRSFISDLMERAIEANGYALKYVDKWKTKNDGLETFFVKNLENVQGDERDVIFIGTVYGPEKKGGPVAQRFGPVTGASGRRRLNVLFSRAKQKIVTFTSMNPSDIKANEGDQSGPAMLREWLTYCELGGTGQEYVKGADKSDDEPSLEKFVRSQVEAMGYPVDQNVGTEGYALDLTVKADSYPLGYLMGLEGDGPSYSQNVSDRDRDRLRPEVLTGLGWKLGRLWSSAWYANPEGELAALKAALALNLDQAQAALAKLPPLAQAPALDGFPSAASMAIEGTEDGDDADAFGDASEDQTISGQTGLAQSEAPDQDSAQDPNVKQVAVGDLVKITYLEEPKSTKEILITAATDDPEQNLISKNSPLGKILIDQEEEDEVQLLVNKTVRNILIESITKGAITSPTDPPRPVISGPEDPGDFEEKPDEKSPPTAGASITNKATNIDPIAGSDNLAANDDQDNEELEDDEEEEEDAIMALVPVPPEDLGRLPDADYRDTLAALCLKLIDALGPIKLVTMSKVLARAHGYNRRGPYIEKAIEKAVAKLRPKTKAPKKEIVYWPLDVEPGPIAPYRGLEVNGYPRDREQIPYPELLGLAKDIINSHPEQERLPAMAAALGIGRVTNGLKVQLGELLRSAASIKL